jgi:hypothetical protein
MMISPSRTNGSSEAMTVALTHANLQIGAIGFRTLLRTIEMFLSVAEKPDLTAPLVESREQLLYWPKTNFDEDLNECTSNRTF